MDDFKSFSFQRTYSSLHYDLVKELTNPLLKKAKKYDRAVGFFSSSWLREVSNGLANFAGNGGTARIVTSVQLSADDWDAIKKGHEEEEIKKVITFQVKNAIAQLEQAIENDTLATLSWMIKEGILQFRFGVPIGRLQGGIFHTKLSVFHDGFDNGVVLFGSQNDSHQASLNEETLNVFTSWGQGKEYFGDHLNDFEERWIGNGLTLKSFSIPDAAERVIIRAGERFQCPYKKQKAKVVTKQRKNPTLGSDKHIREYQERAITNWVKNNYRGLFAMATGTGKTFTAIASSLRLFEDQGKLAIVILAPFKHLVEQWYEELCSFGFDPIRCYSSYADWYDVANTQLRQFKGGLISHFCCLAVNDTATTPRFNKLVDRLDNDWLLIADEVHELGAKNRQTALFPTAKFRIGLSATPSRWYDEEGTSVIEKYFEKTVIEFGLKEAIDAEFLCKYDYNVLKVELSEEEIEEYIKETRILSQLQGNKATNEKQIEFHAIKRARILGGAKGKLPKLVELINEHRREAEQKGEKYLHNLYYCNPGEHRQVLRALSDNGLKVHEFVHSVSKDERERVLKDFSDGEIQGVVAVKCLDQGVNIPATKRAYILASSTNPREYIQRRGRILRTAKGKSVAFLYDFIIGPWGDKIDYSESIAQSLLKRELPRFAEFNELSRIKYKTNDLMRPICEKFGMLDFMYLKPWDIFKKSKSDDPETFVSEAME